MTHEEFIQAVRKTVLEFAGGTLTGEEITKLQTTKLVYGLGEPGLRGVTWFNKWTHTAGVDLVEICAFGEESWTQLAGTTIHELGHVLAGHGAGHSKEWKEACGKLGLRRVHAAGTKYLLANFHPFIRNRLAMMDKPKDGAPVHLGAGLGTLVGITLPKARVCTQGIGTRGGKSRGAGSGSRLRKYVCGHGQIIRASTDELDVTCNVCHTPFELSTPTKVNVVQAA